MKRFLLALLLLPLCGCFFNSGRSCNCKPYRSEEPKAETKPEAGGNPFDNGPRINGTAPSAALHDRVPNNYDPTYKAVKPKCPGAGHGVAVGDGCDCVNLGPDKDCGLANCRCAEIPGSAG